jgi:hypothetical protein
MSVGDDGKVQNDIIISLLDLSISRFHCQIDYSKGFNIRKSISDINLAFLMLNHERLSKETKLPNLSGDLMHNILSYFEEKRQFYITDCGSVAGTFVKLKHREQKILKKGQIYCLGNECSLIIEDICYDQETYNESIFKAYVKECKNRGYEIIGLEFLEIDINENEENEFLNETQEIGQFTSQM